MKDAIIQVDKIDSPESVNECVYVEKGSITITQKATTSADKEYDYEDEVFEECDEESVAVSWENINLFIFVCGLQYFILRKCIMFLQKYFVVCIEHLCDLERVIWKGLT